MKKALVILCIFIITNLTACSNAVDPDATSTTNYPITTDSVSINGKETHVREIQSEVSGDTEQTEIIQTEKMMISNNGGSVVQNGNNTYFYAPNDNVENTESEWAIYVLHQNDNDMTKEKIAELNGHWQKKFFISDNFIFVTDYNEKGYNIITISLDTGEKKELCEGELELIDVQKKEIYYTVSNYHLSVEEKGIYKMNLDGSNIKKLCPEGYTFIEKIDDLIYLDAPHADKNNDAVLASMNSDGSDLINVATIPALTYEGDMSEYEYIVDFGICEDWIILSVGNYQGSGHFFYGSLVRLKKDGQQLERFYPSEVDSFDIIDGWIYFNEWNERNAMFKDGCYRMSPDLSEKEYLGQEIHRMESYSEDGYIYYTYNVPAEIIVNDLRQCTPDGKNAITLFHGNMAPQFEDSSYISYKDIETTEDYVYFGVGVHGYAVMVDSWRGHSCYYAYYRVRKDGSDLEFLYKDANLECPVPPLDLTE